MGFEARVTVLGHLLRGGTPTAFDRLLAAGIPSDWPRSDAVHEGDFATMVALRGTDIVRVPIGDGVGESKTVDAGLFEAAVVFSGERKRRMVSRAAAGKGYP